MDAIMDKIKELLAKIKEFFESIIAKFKKAPEEEKPTDEATTAG